MKHIVFITNPISGTISKAGIPELVEVHLDHARFSYEFVSTQYAGHATLLAQEAAARGADIVCAIGGDGTVNEVGRGSLAQRPLWPSFLVVLAMAWRAISCCPWT